MSNKPDILAETISFARSNAEMSTYDREAWEAHARNCSAALAERDRLREVCLSQCIVLQAVDVDGHASPSVLQQVRAVLKRAEGGV